MVNDQCKCLHVPRVLPLLPVNWEVVGSILSHVICTGVSIMLMMVVFQCLKVVIPLFESDIAVR